MKTTLTLAKADIGSIGGHIKPGARLMDVVTDYMKRKSKPYVKDFYISHTGDDIAVLMTHARGVGDPRVHRLVWDAFTAGAEDARKQGLYGAGQDLLKDAFSGNIKGLGPAVCEMEIRGAPQRALPDVRRGQDRPRRLQPAALPGLRRPDVQRGPDPEPRDVQGLQVHHNGRLSHRGRPGDRAQRARADLRHRRAAARQPALRGREHPLAGDRRASAPWSAPSACTTSPASTPARTTR